MLAAYVSRFDRDNPLDGLAVGEVPEAAPPAEHPEWAVVEVRAAALNQHDLWSLRGVGLREEQLPMVLGCDGVGTTADGREVIVHAVVGALPAKGVPAGTEARSILSERYPGTIAEKVAVPAENLVDKPAWLSWEEAACLPTAWLTAHRAIFRTGGAEPGEVLLVQGAGGGVATAAIVLGVAAGLEVHVTSRSAERRARVAELGATPHEPGARLPVRADVVLESVGKATWTHSVASVRAGGAIVVVGATTGDPEPASITRIFFHELRVLGSTMGTTQDLRDLLALLERTGARPIIDSSFALAEAREAFARLERGEQFGKIVLTV